MFSDPGGMFGPDRHLAAILAERFSDTFHAQPSIHPGSRPQPAPAGWEYAGLMITYWCNAKCAFCYVYSAPDRGGEMQVADAVQNVARTGPACGDRRESDAHSSCRRRTIRRLGAAHIDAFAAARTPA